MCNLPEEKLVVVLGAVPTLELIEEIRNNGKIFQLAERLDREEAIAALVIDADVLGLDSLSIAALVFAQTRRIGILPRFSIGRRHPINVARQLTSLDYLSAGRTGWSIAASDIDTENPWAKHGSGNEIRLEFIRAVRNLWASWPRETLLGSREHGIFHVKDGIRTINHTTIFEIEGPLNIPAPAIFPPLVALADDEASEADLVEKIHHGKTSLIPLDQPLFPKSSRNFKLIRVHEFENLWQAVRDLTLNNPIMEPDRECRLSSRWGIRSRSGTANKAFY